MPPHRTFAYVLLAVAVLFGAHSISAQSAACPSDMHSAAANEVPGVAAGTCTPNKGTNQLWGGCSSNPYPIVERYKTNAGAHVTPGQNGSTLENGINPTLACRLSQFLPYAQQHGCTLKIESAYRSAAEQRAICGNGGTNCGSPGASCHQYGLAVDLRGSSQCMSWAKSFLGSKNPGSPGAQQFKLHWPIPGDDGHTQCIENMRGNCIGVTQGCDGNIIMNPGTDPGGSQMPLQSMGNSIGNALSPQQAATASAPAAQQTQVPSTPVSQTYQQTIDASFQTATGTTSQYATTTPVNYYPNAPVDNTPPTIHITAPTDSGPTPTSATQHSALDDLNDLANGAPESPDEPAHDEQAGTPVPLNNGIYSDVRTLPNDQENNASNEPAPGAPGAARQPATFTSPDMNQDASKGGNAAPAASADSALTTIQLALREILDVLQPFGSHGLPLPAPSRAAGSE